MLPTSTKGRTIMLVLGIDTSSKVGSIAISKRGVPLGRETISVDMDHSANLLPSDSPLYLAFQGVASAGCRRENPVLSLLPEMELEPDCASQLAVRSLGNMDRSVES